MSSIATLPTANKNFWQGAQIRIRGIEPEDAETLHRWNFDGETARMVDFLWPPTSLAGTRAWAQRMATQEFKDDQFHGIIESNQGEMVGLFNSHSTNRRTGTFSYGISIGEAYRGRGYASEAIVLLLRYFFEELRYQKVNATVYSCNDASMALHEKLGFMLEGRLRRMVFTRGHYYDELLYGMTQEEFTERYGDGNGAMG